MRYHADLHIHSKHSRATSKNADLGNLAYWAGKKGIAVVGTGDFTHPAWLAELKQKLVRAEPGFYRLRPEIERGIAERLPAACQTPARFMLSVEISTIYKKGEHTRKIHHLIYVPDFAAADRVVARLARIGNIASDGRPILGLDSRDLLEIVLESSPDAYLVPAHIWTPWFAVLGSRSGFDSLAECYGDLADHIFAVETGLSSDPAMNWRISFLDRYRLVSNSDAHSPAKLGREATQFDCDLDYFALRRALETGQGYGGTVEFFPEEGKYHLDGHRKCGVCLSPEETRAHGGRCPVCGQPVTVGVMHRVDALADRSEGEAAPPETAGSVSSLVPLPEILSELLGSGPNSKTVAQRYERVLAGLGAELPLLEEVPLEDIRHADSGLLSEAIARLRAGQVIRDAGYDGEYGVIRLFEPAELKRLTAGGLLFDFPDSGIRSQGPGIRQGEQAAQPRRLGEDTRDTAGTQHEAEATVPNGTSPILAGLDAAQRAAAEIVEGPLLILAGPGAGKTRTLTHRIAYLVAERGVPAAGCLAITFTRRAAAELAERLARLIPEQATEVPVHTFHSLGLAILKEHANAAGLHRGFSVAPADTRTAALAARLDCSERKARRLLNAISRAKRTGEAATEEVAAALAAYQDALALRNWLDFDDLVGLALRTLANDPGLAALTRDRFPWISVDEFQDLDAQQYALLRLLAPEHANLCVIGDPNQAIYGFRGADAAVFARFRADYPRARTARLSRNYRSSGTIVAASGQVISAALGEEATEASAVVRALAERITLHTAPSDRAEAEFVVQSIEHLLGGHSFFSIDSGRGAAGAAASLAFSDIAVLYRSEAQLPALTEALGRSGLPFQASSHRPLAERPGVAALLQVLDAVPAEAAGGSLRARLRIAAEQVPTSETSDRTATEAALHLLSALAARCGDDAARFAEALPLASEADGWDAQAERISLLTLHAAKGLEFPVIFIVGLEDGLLPLHWGPRDPPGEAEERRLFYVGMTRAMDRLFLCRAAKRLWRGVLRELPPSPFLAAIEAALIEQSRSEARKKTELQRQMELF